MLKKLALFTIVFLMIFSVAACQPAETAATDAPQVVAPATAPPTQAAPSEAPTEAPTEAAYTGKTGLVIGFSNSYNGNTYRQALERAFMETMDKLKGEGIVKDYIMTVSNNNIAVQISDIQSLILAGVDGIVLCPGSQTALNAAVESAVEAGIPVLTINQGPLTTDVGYEIVPNWVDLGVVEAEYVVEKMGGANAKGNVLIIRGISGTACDTGMYKGHTEVLAAKAPGLKVVAEVYGEWTHATALAAIEQALPSLPEIDLVLTQGGDEYATVLAFQNAGRDLPLIVGGNRGDFLQWWIEEYDKSGYNTISGSGNASAFGSTSAYMIVDIINGQVDINTTRIMYLPFLIITPENLKDFSSIRTDEVAGEICDWDYVRNVLQTQRN